MTQHGKCAVCRWRKIKCDETKPKCTSCVKSGRECEYRLLSTATADEVKDDSASVRLKSVGAAANNQGSFHRFKVVGPSQQTKIRKWRPYGSPSRAPSNQFTKLVATYAFYFCKTGDFSSLCPNLFKGIVTTRIGFNRVLDAAVTYTIDCHVAFFKHDPNKSSLVARSFGIVLKALQESLNNCKAEPEDAVVLAVALVTRSEFYRNNVGRFYLTHADGLCNMLRLRWKFGHWGELEELLFRSVSIEETSASLYLGRPSIFDDSERRKVKARETPPQQDEVDHAISCVVEQLVKLPRLVSDLRRLLSDPTNESLAVTMLESMQSVYHFTDKAAVELVIKRRSSEVFEGITMHHSKEPPGFSIQYTSQKLFALAVFYHQYCILISGVIQRLFEINSELAAAIFSLEVAENEDVHAAECIAASVTYAFSSEVDARARAIRMATPNGCSFTTWYRLEKRSGQNAVQLEHARLMQTFCINVNRRIQTLWRTGGGSWDTMDTARMSEMVSGGPIFPEFVTGIST